MSDETVEQIETATPVAEPKTNKFKMVLFISLAALVSGNFIFQHFIKPTKKDKVEVNEEVSNISAPKLTQVSEQIKQMEEIIQHQPQVFDRGQKDEEVEKLTKMRMLAPTTVYSANGNGAAASKTALNQANGAQEQILGGQNTGDNNTGFMKEVSQSHVPIVKATHILHPGFTLVQGSMLMATLESRIQSDLPGIVRAVTSQDVYSEDESTVLIPKGSRLIGQYSNGILQGQQRVFVVWQRLIRPDHIDIQLNSPGTDALGAAGVNADSIDRHFFQQFGTASLLSLIGAGVADVGVNSQDEFNSASAYRQALSNSFGQTASSTLKSTGMINPTLYIDQGKVISVFVARDLDFFSELTSREAL